MHQLIKRIENSLNKDLLGITISNPRKAGEIRRYVIRPVLIREKLMYQLAAYTATQVFHENLTGGQLCGRLSEILPDYKQVLMQTASADIQALINKKGKAAIKITPRLKNEASVIKVRDLSHNRKKNYILKEGTPVPFLKDLGVMTGEGKIVRAKYDKFRQINRFLEYIEDIIPCLPADREITILDFGCGKSYLTFAVYYYLHEIRSMPVKIIGLDLKKDVIRTCSRLAAKYGYEKLDFYEGAIEEFEGVSQVDMVITLHACDTATDFALNKAVSWGASVILSVPCCQHELNAQLKNGQYSIITDYGILKERFAALATDGIRASMLEAV